MLNKRALCPTNKKTSSIMNFFNKGIATYFCVLPLKQHPQDLCKTLKEIMLDIGPSVYISNIFKMA